MSVELLEALKQLQREKNIEPESIIEALEEALASAFKRNNPEIETAEVNLDRETGKITVFAVDLDEEGNETGRNEVTPRDFGRLAAQTAKQVVLQRIRDAERDLLYDEYSDREGDIITGIVEQSDHRYTLINLGRVEALLPPQEQVPKERYDHGSRLKTLILEVRRSPKGPQIIVSRSHPGLLKRLFELEVPEIYDGYVEIKSVAREPGQRSKVAVASRDSSIDPVGACVGPKGSRVRMVVNELRGEKIDVVEWSEDPSVFVANSLSPAKVKEVTLDPADKRAEVTVPDHQLSLAIGKEGQNARLAAKLSGWRVDIKSESQIAEEAAHKLLGGIKSRGEAAADDGVKSADAKADQQAMCAAITSSGTPCKSKAKPGSKYCGRHQKLEEVALEA